MIAVKKITPLFAVLFTLLLVPSCEDDVTYIEVPAAEEPLITDRSNVTVVNSESIQLGTNPDDRVFKMHSTIMNQNGRVVETTLNCCAMAGVPLKGDEVDSTRTVENVTLINRGIIEVHTKDLVAQYADSIRTPAFPHRPYQYLRLLVMYAGKNSTVVNEGTINVYFDHDPELKGTVYVMGLVGGEGSSLINNGEINFYGTGSVATRLRGMATFGSDISALNNGRMTADVALSEDARMITTGGDRSNVINNGTMRLRLPGTVLCMTRYGDSNLINNNLVDITYVAPPEGYQLELGTEQALACALYEPLQASRKGMPGLLNRGTIQVRIEGNERMSPHAQAYGMFTDLMGAGAEKHEVHITNDGTIHISQSGPMEYRMAEAGFVARSTATRGACNIHLRRWKTTLRDFATEGHLFLAQGAKVNYSGGHLVLEKGDHYDASRSYSVAPEDLVFRTGGDSFRYEYSHYDHLKITPARTDLPLVWDKESQTVGFE